MFGKFKKQKKPKIGIALGGGGARGLANAGIFKKLEENAIKPDIIVGSSMGALVGALYLVEGSAEKTMSKLKNVLDTPEFKSLESEFIIKKALSLKTYPLSMLL